MKDLTYVYLGAIGYLDARGYLAEAEMILEWGKEAAVNLRNDFALAEIMVRIGGIAIHKSDLELGIKSLERALDLLDAFASNEPSKMLLQRLHVYSFLARPSIQESPNQGLNWILKGLSEAEKSQEAVIVEHVGYLRSQLSAIHAQLGNTLLAIDEARHSLSLLPTIKSPAGISALINLGVSHEALGNLQASTDSYEQALEIANHIGLTKQVATCLLNLSLILRKTGKFKESITAQKKALELYKRMGDPLFEAGVQINMAANYLRIAEDSEAAILFEKAGAYSRLNPDKVFIKALLLSNQGEFYILSGDINRALESLTEALKITNEIGNNYLLATIKRQLAELALIRGRFYPALQWIEEALALAVDSEDVEEEGICLRVKGEILFLGGLGLPQETFDLFRKSLDCFGDQLMYETGKTHLACLLPLISHKNQDFKFSLEWSMKIAREAFEKSGAVRDLEKCIKIYDDNF